jgi:hypothetical protein
LDDDTISLGSPGGFPSDLAWDGDDRIYAVKDALIPATVVGYDVTTAPQPPLLQAQIAATDLVDHDGVTPARAPTSFGIGLFGAFTGDIEVVGTRWIFVTVGAGNSMSSDASGPLRLANLVVIDADLQRVVQTVNLAWTLNAPGHGSTGAAYLAVPQSLPSMVTFIPDAGGATTGRVYVALSNGAGSSAGLQDFFHGTVQSWRVDFTQPLPLAPDTVGKAPGDATRTYVSAYYNPVGFTRYKRFLVLTNAGASRFTPSFVAEPTTDAVLEFLDVDADVWRDNWTVNLGEILPATGAIALGKDAAGTLFGALASQTFAAAYVVDLSGLDETPVDPLKLRLLRAVELAPGGLTTPGTGYQPGVAVAPDGETAYVASFTDGALRVLSLPDDIELGDIGIDEAPYDVLGLAGSSLGACVAPSGAFSEVFFLVNGTFDASFNPVRSSFIGTVK